MSGWGKIAIGVRSANGGDAVFLRSWTRLITKGLRKGDEVLDPVTELPHHYAANALVDTFLASSKCNTLLWVDDDMVFPQDTLERLRKDPKTFNYDIMQALYIQRKPPHYPLVIKKDPTSETGHRLDPKPAKNTVVEVGVVGMGFTLMRRDMLMKMRKDKPKDKLLFYWGENGDSEDACFCFNAQKAGYRLGVHTGITAGHRMGMVMDWDGEQLQVLTRKMVKK